MLVLSFYDGSITLRQLGVSIKANNKANRPEGHLFIVPNKIVSYLCEKYRFKVSVFSEAIY